MTPASYAFKRRLTLERRSATRCLSPQAQLVLPLPQARARKGQSFACPSNPVLCRFMPAPILPLIDAVAHWPPRGALIGLDLGTKTIGVAASDPDRRLATGVETLQRKAFKLDAARLLALAAERKAVGFVLGLPINMDGSEGPRAQSTRAFARNFAGLTNLAIGLWDERLSTVAVERELIGMDVSRARRAEVIDEHAAIFILQGALDRLARLRESRTDR
jgi:putative holliday junction resolvase